MISILWVGVIERYIETGDINTLAKNVRDYGVPPECRDGVADILLGKLSPKKQTPDRYLKSEYDSAISAVKNHNRMIDDFNKLYLQVGLPKRFSKLTQRDLKRAISLSSKLSYGGNYETVRRIINRKVQKKGWESLPD